MNTIILLCATIVVFILVALGVDFGLTPVEMTALGLALFAGAHLPPRG